MKELEERIKELTTKTVKTLGTDYEQKIPLLSPHYYGVLSKEIQDIAIDYFNYVNNYDNDLLEQRIRENEATELTDEQLFSQFINERYKP